MNEQMNEWMNTGTKPLTKQLNCALVMVGGKSNVVSADKCFLGHYASVDGTERLCQQQDYGATTTQLLGL